MWPPAHLFAPRTTIVGCFVSGHNENPSRNDQHPLTIPTPKHRLKTPPTEYIMQVLKHGPGDATPVAESLPCRGTLGHGQTPAGPVRRRVGHLASYPCAARGKLGQRRAPHSAEEKLGQRREPAAPRKLGQRREPPRRGKLGQRRAPQQAREPRGGFRGVVPPGKHCEPMRNRPKGGEYRATPGGYGGKPPGVAIIGVPTGARNAGSGAPTGDQSTDMNATRKLPPYVSRPNYNQISGQG